MTKKIIKRRKIRRRGNKPAGKQYFNEDTHAAILKFNETECLYEREKIYNEFIKDAFEKLTENLIFIYKFKGEHTTMEELKNDCVAFLYEKIGKFNGDKATKAFSYFNVVGKRYLIVRSQKRVKSQKRNVSIAAPESFSNREKVSFNASNMVGEYETAMEHQQRKDKIFEILEIIKSEAKNEAELNCMEAITILFKTADDLDFLNKRAVFVYLREMSGLTPKKLTSTISNLKKRFREIRKRDDFNQIF